MSPRAAREPDAGRPDLAGLRAGLPDALGGAVAGFEQHLRLERNRSAHTVRAYVGDVVGYLDHLARLGGRSPADMTLASLRGWLALMRDRSASRATLARRSAALRSFSAWAHRSGLTADDPGRPVAPAGPATSAACGELVAGSGVALRWPDGALTPGVGSHVTGLGPADGERS